MRQFFSWRIWAALAALVGLLVLLKVVLPAGATDEPVASETPDRTVDFISFVYQVQPANRFFMLDGLVNGSADVVIDGQRTMHLVQGTPGSIDCPDYKEIGRCVVVADLLGDAVIWFDLVPVEPGYKVNAPPIVDILDDGIVRLENGWLVRAANSIDRRCKQETGSLREFIDTLGPTSTTIIDVATQRVTAVVCSDTDATDPDASSTSSTGPTGSTVLDPSASTTIEPGGSSTTIDPAADTIPQEG